MNTKVYRDGYSESRNQEQVVQDLDLRGENKENSVLQEEQPGYREEKTPAEKTKEIRDISTYTHSGPIQGQLNSNLVGGLNPNPSPGLKSSVQGSPVYTRDSSTQPMLQGTKQKLLIIDWVYHAIAKSQLEKGKFVFFATVF